MVRGKGHKVQEVLSVSEKDDLLSQKRELQDSLKEKKSYGIGTQAEQIDEVKIRRQIQHIDDAISSREVKTTGPQKDALIKEEAALAEQLQVGLPTRDEMDHPARNPGAIRKHMSWTVRNQANIDRWRYIQKVLRPDDPRSIENMRREK